MCDGTFPNPLFIPGWDKSAVIELNQLFKSSVSEHRAVQAVNLDCGVFTDNVQLGVWLGREGVNDLTCGCN